MRQWVDFTWLVFLSVDSAQACQRVDTVNVHRTRSTDSLSARSSECQGGIELVLDLDLISVVGR